MTRVPDTKYTRPVEKVLNRVFKRHDLQPPMVNTFSIVVVAFWLVGAAVAYGLAIPPLQDTLRIKLALLYSWSALIFEPSNARAFKEPIAWGILAVVAMPVLLPMVFAASMAKKALYLPEAQKAAQRQGRKHPEELVAKELTDGIPLGHYGEKQFGVERGDDRGHVLVSAPTRAGKGLHLTCTLFCWRGAAVVVDPKPEQYQRTSGHRKMFGPIYHLPIQGIDIVQYFDVTDALDLQELFATLMQTWQDREPIFSQKAFAIFEAARDVSAATGEHMLALLGRWANGSVKQFVEDADPFAWSAVERFVDGNREEFNRFTLASWGTFTAKFGPLIPHLPAISTPDIPPAWAEANATIYICYPLDQLKAAGGLLSVILAALMKGQQRRPRKVHTLFAIDELPTAAIQDLDIKLATVGGYGVTILAYVQQLAQLRKVYGHDASDSIMGNFHHQIFYPTRDNDSAEYVSRKFGTEVQLTRSRHEGGAAYQQREEPALSPTMVNTLPATTTIIFSDDVVTMSQRLNPFVDPLVSLPAPAPLMVRQKDGSQAMYTVDGKLIGVSKGRRRLMKEPAPQINQSVGAKDEANNLDSEVVDTRDGNNKASVEDGPPSEDNKLHEWF